MLRTIRGAAVLTALLTIGPANPPPPNPPPPPEQAAPSLRVDSPLDATTTVKTTTRAKALMRELRVTSISKAALMIRAEVGPLLRAADGVVVGDVTWKLGDKERGTLENEPFSLDAGRTAILRVEASLPADGDYVIPGAILHDGVRETFRVLVTRARTTSVEMQPVETVLAGNLWSPGSTDATVPVALKETAGQETTLALPTLAALTLRDGAGRYAGSWTAFDIDSTARCKKQDTIVLGPYETCVVPVHIQGLRGAGEYEALVRVASAEALTVEQKIVLLVKRPAWLAAVFIALGAFLSAGIRGWLRKSRPALIARRDLVPIAAELDSVRRRPGSDRILRLVKLLDTRLSTLEERLRFGEPVDAAGTDALRVATKLLVEAADLQAEILAADPGIRQDAQSAVDAALQSLEGASSPTGTELTAIARARSELESKLRAWVSDQAKALAVTASALTGGDPDVRERLSRSLGEVDKRAGEGLVRASTAALARSRRWWLALRASTLTAARPEGMSDDDRARLEAFEKTLEGELAKWKKSDPEREAGALDEAFAGWLRLAADALDRSIQGGRVTPADSVGALGLLSEARSALARGDLDRAEASYRSAAAAPRLGAKGITGPRLVGVVPGAAPRRAIDRPDPAKISASLTRRAYWTDLFVNVLVLLIAVASGIYVLWIPDAKWGSAGSMLLAFLWGLGLREVGGVAFQGLDPLRQRFGQDSGSPPAGGSKP